MDTTKRNLLFWSLMVFLAVFSWKVLGGSGDSQTVSYSDFLIALDRGELLAVTINLSRDSAEIVCAADAEKPQPRIRTVIAREMIPEIVQRLHEKHIALSFFDAGHSDWASIFINVIPLFLILGLWGFMIRQMQAQAKQRASKEGTSQ